MFPPSRSSRSNAVHENSLAKKTIRNSGVDRRMAANTAPNCSAIVRGGDEPGHTPVAARSELVERDEHAGGLQRRRHEQHRGRRLLEARLSARQHRQHESRHARSERRDDARCGAHGVPLKRDEHADAGEDECAAEEPQHPNEHRAPVAFCGCRRRFAEGTRDLSWQ